MSELLRLGWTQLCSSLAHLTFIGLLVGTKPALSRDLCSSTWQDFQEKLKRQENRLAFENSGGPLRIGLCWWHSRFQRNANYLLDFRPWLPDSNRNEVWSVLKALTKGRHVVAINGYRHLFEFSDAYRDEIQELLGQWQLYESFLEFNWVKGLKNPQPEFPGQLNEVLSDVEYRVKVKHEVVYQMLKYPGLVSHAWLVYDIENFGFAYKIHAIDSNNLYNVESFVFKNSEGIIGNSRVGFPYTQHTEDMDTYHSAITRTCRRWGRSSKLAPRN